MNEQGRGSAVREHVADRAWNALHNQFATVLEGQLPGGGLCVRVYQTVEAEREGEAALKEGIDLWAT
jgi:hypothetical protein